MSSLARAIVPLTLLLLASVSVASGPLVPGVDLTASRTDASSPAFGHGGADVDDVALADGGFALERGDYGADAYYLVAPDAVVRLSNVTGRPLLVYDISVPDLGYTRLETTVLTDASPPAVRLPVKRDPISPGKVTRDGYDARVRVFLRVEDEKAVLFDRRETVEVVS